MLITMLRCRGVCFKFSVDLFPILLIPMLTILASISFKWTMGTFICTAVGLFFLQKKFEQIKPRSTFFIAWILTSVIWLILIFNIFVLAMMEILPEENFFLAIMIIASLGCLYHSKMKAQKTLLPFNKASYIDGDMSDRDIDNLVTNQHIDQPFFCKFCQANVQNKNHSIWLNCCIGPENEKLFISGNVLGMIALLYGSNLALTTICHPFIFYYPYIRFLLPDDCSDVYFTSSTSISFVSAIYGILISAQIAWYLFKVVLKKIGCAGSRLNCNNILKL